MLHRYFSECVNFTCERRVNRIHRNMLKQYFCLIWMPKGNGNQGVQQNAVLPELFSRNVDSGTLKANYASNNLIG